MGICTAVMWHGFEVVRRMLEGIDSFLDGQGYQRYEDVVGLSLAHLAATADTDLGEGNAEVDPARCRSCGRCIKPAHCDGVVEESGGIARVIAERCLGCGVCVDLCPYDAIRMVTTS